MKVNADEETLDEVEFEQLQVGDEVFVVTRHESGQTFMAQGNLSHKNFTGAWMSGGFAIVVPPNEMNDWVRENRKIYRKKFVFPKAWGSIVEAWDEVIKETRRFVRVAEDEWAREVDGNAYNAEEILHYYSNPKVIRNGV
jgi:hypothetical protein